MDKLRLQRYLETLTERERAAVAAAIDTQQRPTLERLWHICTELVEQGRSLKRHKRAIFEYIFGEAYSTEHDWRLRHEYRLLVNTIEHILGEEYVYQKLRSDPLFANELLLEVLAQRELWTEFDDVLSDSLDRAARQHNYQMVFRFQLLAISATLRKGMFSHERMCETIEWIDRAIGTLGQFCGTEYEHLAALRSATGHMLDAEGVHYPPLPSLDLDQETTLQRYYRLKREAVRYTGAQRLDAARASAELIESIATEPGTPLFAERISAVATLGVLLMIVANDYTESASVSRRALELAQQHNDPAVVPLLAFNYCSALMKAGVWCDVLSFLERNPAVLNDRRVGFRFALLRSYAYVFLGDAEKAQESVPVASRRYPIGEYHYAWYLYAIIAFIRGDIEDALREIENLHKHFVRQKLCRTLATDYELTGLFKKFFAAMLNQSLRRRATAQRQIESALDRIATTVPHYHDYLPLIWLRGQLDRLSC
ncbi:MAG: hypothetical protein N2663_05485 [Chlorobi bacterium]|nr:hypothetical protein [Chlorobiota bacterium]